MEEQYSISLPVTVLVVIAALDAADKALLGASFPWLEKTLHLHGEYILYMNIYYVYVLFYSFVVYLSSHASMNNSGYIGLL